ncbi:MAG: GtrA family protein [Oscillospiraceae bacterium]|nr:GtrA family protein [Oscillospiraceae bacterium]
MNLAVIVISDSFTFKLQKDLTELKDNGFDRIYVVCDGEVEATYDSVTAIPGCIYLSPTKGDDSAAKQALELYLHDTVGYDGVLLFDHYNSSIASNAVMISDTSKIHPSELILAVDNKDRRKGFFVGLSCLLLRLVGGISVGSINPIAKLIPHTLVQPLLSTRAVRDIDIGVLFEAKRQNLPILELPLSTKAEYQPTKGSFVRLIRIILLLLKFVLSSLLSTILDLLLFTIFNRLLLPIVMATRIFIGTTSARVCSGLFNFFLNKSFVFSSHTGTARFMLRYASVWVLILLLSSTGTYLLSVIHLPTLLSKVLVDGSLFWLSFYLQREWVFLPENKKRVD